MNVKRIPYIMEISEHLMVVLNVAIIIGGFLTMIILISYFRIRKSERMALISTGYDPENFKKMTREANPNSTLKFGLLMIGVGIGLLVGEFLQSVTPIAPEVAYFSMILFFGGLGLLISHILKKNNLPNENNM